MGVVGTMRGPIIATILAICLAACSPPAGSPPAGAPTYSVAGHAVAGPVCPVEPADAKPGQCDPRPVAGAMLLVTDDEGHEIAILTTGQDGGFATTLPAGSYALTPQPVAGLMGGAEPIAFEVLVTDHPTDLVVAYDTGIR